MWKKTLAVIMAAAILVSAVIVLTNATSGVDPESAMPVALADYMVNAITLDGKFHEPGWNVMSNKLTPDEPGAPNTHFDVVFDKNNLYLGFDLTDAVTVKITIGEGAAAKSATINFESIKSGETQAFPTNGLQGTWGKNWVYAEAVIPLAANGINLTSYDQKIPMTLVAANAMDISASFEGFAVPVNNAIGQHLINLRGTNVLAGDTVISSDISPYFSQQTNNYYVWSFNNTYVAGNTTAASAVGVNLSTRSSNANDMSSITGTIVADFAVNVKDMPQYTASTYKYWKPNAGTKGMNLVLTSWQTRGGLSMNITNIDGKLTLAIFNHNTQDYNLFDTGCGFGDVIHVTVLWGVAGDIIVFINDRQVGMLNIGVGEIQGLHDEAAVLGNWPAGHVAMLGEKDKAMSSAADNMAFDIHSLFVGTSQNLLETMGTGWLNGQSAVQVKSDLALPTELSDGLMPATITWKSSNESVITADGKVTRPAVDTEVTLTASYSEGRYTKNFVVKVMGEVARIGGTSYKTMAAALAAATAGDTITIVNDTTMEDGQAFPEGVSLDLNGRTVTKAANANVTIPSDHFWRGKTELAKITWMGVPHALNGTITVVSDDYSKLDIQQTEIDYFKLDNSKAFWVDTLKMQAPEGIAKSELLNATFQLPGDTTVYKFFDYVVNASAAENWYIHLSTYLGDHTDNVLTYKFDWKGDGTYEQTVDVSISNCVLKAGSLDVLKEAIALNDRCTIKLTKNIVLTEVVDLTNLKFDFNGKTLTKAEGVTIDAPTGYYWVGNTLTAIIYEGYIQALNGTLFEDAITINGGSAVYTTKNGTKAFYMEVARVTAPVGMRQIDLENAKVETNNGVSSVWDLVVNKTANSGWYVDMYRIVDQADTIIDTFKFDWDADGEYEQIIAYTMENSYLLVSNMESLKAAVNKGAGYTVKLANDVKITESIDLSKLEFNFNSKALTKADGITVIIPEGYLWDEDGKLAKMLSTPVVLSNIELLVGAEPAIRFWMSDTSVFMGDDYYAAVTRSYADFRADVITYITKDQWDRDGYQYYITVDGIQAKEMTDAISVQIYRGEIGQGVPVSDDWRDSVMGCATRLLVQSADEAAKRYAVDMLNYGAAAQKYAGYKTTYLANANLSSSQKALASGAVTKTNQRSNSVGSYHTTLLDFEDNIVMEFQYSNQVTRAVIAYTDHNGTKVSYDMTFENDRLRYDAQANKYRVIVDGLTLADIDTMVSCTIYNRGVRLGTTTDSVGSCLARMTADSSGVEKALYTEAAKFATLVHSWAHGEA